MTEEAQTSADQPVVTEPAATKASKLSKIKKVSLKDKRVIRALFELVLVAAIVVLSVLVVNLNQKKTDLNKQVATLNANPQLAIQKQTDSLIASVHKIYPSLPTNETPTIAEVSDPAKAKTQSAFFANAKKGDKVLLYVKAGQAFLYRPSTNQLVNVAPLTFSNTGSSTPAATTPTTTKK